MPSGPSLYYVSKGTGWVGSNFCQFLLMFSTIQGNVEWVGGSEKIQKFADVIKGCSLPYILPLQPLLCYRLFIFRGYRQKIGKKPNPYLPDITVLPILLRMTKYVHCKWKWMTCKVKTKFFLLPFGWKNTKTVYFLLYL